MIIVQTPLRISLAGGGTDFREFYAVEPGMVINMAIDKYVYVIVKDRFDDRIHVNCSKKEIADSVDEIQHELVREAMKRTGVEKGVEIITLADIPEEGSGLGSSSSVTVGLLNALYMYQGEQVNVGRLAQEACEIEMDICGKPMGKQDQYIAAYGSIRFIQFNPDESTHVRKISLSSKQIKHLESTLLLFYTGRTRKASTILKEQKQNIINKMDTLCQIKSLVAPMEKAIRQGQYHLIGQLLHQNWAYKRKLASGISDPYLDSLYERALMAGAVGGKISGAGGGGFLLLQAPPYKQEALREALKDLRELPFSLERDGSKVIFNMRRSPAKSDSQ